MKTFTKNLSGLINKVWTDLNGFRNTAIEFKDQSCIQQFNECMMDLMKMRPQGFQIQTLEPSSPNYQIQL